MLEGMQRIRGDAPDLSNSTFFLNELDGLENTYALIAEICERCSTHHFQLDSYTAMLFPKIPATDLQFVHPSAELSVCLPGDYVSHEDVGVRLSDGHSEFSALQRTLPLLSVRSLSNSAQFLLFLTSLANTGLVFLVNGNPDFYQDVDKQPDYKQFRNGHFPNVKCF